VLCVDIVVVGMDIVDIIVVCVYRVSCVIVVIYCFVVAVCTFVDVGLDIATVTVYVIGITYADDRVVGAIVVTSAVVMRNVVVVRCRYC